MKEGSLARVASGLAVVCTMWIPLVSAAPTPSRVVAAGAKLEAVFEGGVFLKGPAAAPDGSIYVSDVTRTSKTGMQAGHIWRYDPRSRTTAIFRSPSGMANGLAFDAEGRLLAAEGADFGGRRVTRTDLKTGKSYIIAGVFDGRPFNAPNDLAVDVKGRVYFTDPRYLGHEPIEQPVTGIYRIDPDGSVRRIAGDLRQPNGIAISADQSTLYVITCGTTDTDILQDFGNARTAHSALHSYDLRADGTVTYRRTLVDFGAQKWGDGMTVDADGNLYVAVGGPPAYRGVHVYRPSGQMVEIIPTPENAANVEFGRGPELQRCISQPSKSCTAFNCRHPGSVSRGSEPFLDNLASRSGGAVGRVARLPSLRAGRS